MDRFKLPSRQPSLPNNSMGQQLPPAAWVNPGLRLGPHIRECPRCREPLECPFPQVPEHKVLRKAHPDSPLEWLPCLEVEVPRQDRREVLEQAYGPQQGWRRLL